MSEPLFEVNAAGVDVNSLVAEIRATVDRKLAEGVYRDARIARAERTNLAGLRNDDEFFTYYLANLREAAFVDISDFEIRERRRGFAPMLVRFKKTLWGLLKFYTYRLWSQQNQVNGLLVTALECLDNKYQARIRALEQRIADLDQRRADKP